MLRGMARGSLRPGLAISRTGNPEGMTRRRGGQVNIDYNRAFDLSYWRITKSVRNGQTFLDRFYEDFISISDEIRAKFKHTNMKAQKQMLAVSLGHMARLSVNRIADEQLQEIARRHSKKDLNIEPALYDEWLECMIRTATLFDPDWDQEVELAWRLMLSTGVTYMKFMYDK